MVWRFFALTFLLGCQFRLAKQELLRVVTWNVGDNAKMVAYNKAQKKGDDGFTDGAIDLLLDLDRSDHSQIADIFAVSLQENCWKCDESDLKAEAIPNLFLKRLVARGFVGYEIEGIQGTRVSSKCEEGCAKSATHGTTAVFVIAKKGIVTSHKAFKHIEGCSDKTPPNEEKGVAAMRLELNDKQSVCVASTHLESREPSWRRKCLFNFFQDKKAESDLKWPECDLKVIAGDYNTRTAGKVESTQISYLLERPDKNMKEFIEKLREKDEMAGKNPFVGKEITDKNNLLWYINQHQPQHQKSDFKESAFTFVPTYKLQTYKETDLKKNTDCAGKSNGICYASTHPQSWTDRIIHSESKTTIKSLKYGAIYKMHDHDWSDHLPVFQVFQL